MSILTIDRISKYYNLDGTNQERALNDVHLRDYQERPCYLQSIWL